MIENNFNIRDKQRCRQTIFEGEVVFRFVIVDRPYMHRQILCTNTSYTKFLRYSLVVSMEKSKFTNFKNSYKIYENSSGDQEKTEI